ncbi:MAG TPA: aminotransferase class V-fold PLP-dependent enzyme [Gemmatimonadales bacterium]|nr:aminotransferase class V-fold PLP-dependent enzyme [Gemmatimonadales bacterium]
MSGAIEAPPLAHYRAEFPVFDRQIYLNTCSLGALSRRTRARVLAFLDEWDARGSAAWYDAWWGALDALRRRYAALINAPPRDVALHAAVSTATGVLASALDYQARPRVVTTSLDFPTVAYQWLAKRPAGVEVIVVESVDGVSVPLEAFARAIDDRTALVATSHVFFTSGYVLDIRGLAELAHARGAWCYVDAYQSVGQIPVDVQASGVDFLTAGGLKWLLGGPGIVFLYVRGEITTRLRPTVTGWFAHQEQFRFDSRQLDFHDDARRFEQGTPALAAVHAQLGGLDVLEDVGLDRVFAATRDLTEDLISRARAAGLRPKVAADSGHRSAIVMIPVDDPAREVRRLSSAGIVADSRHGHVRLSPFFYNTPDDHERAIHVLTS